MTTYGDKRTVTPNVAPSEEGMNMTGPKAKRSVLLDEPCLGRNRCSNGKCKHTQLSSVFGV
ncbi:hypothetical protein ZHAS_00008555 [Anopheles sinensis]|uniref:Uncharacterized protein n=1 Tax=Anopheles sinensis TaxID=74873 RepID=A0A084VT04_ANOSI|nr:hypothetical protein ZHAS_00008555 [Anopheles sinensis]